MNKLMALVLISLFLTSCTTTTGIGKNGFNPEFMAKIKTGVTKKAEILEWFGNPHDLSLTVKGQEVYKYVYMSAKDNKSINPFAAPQAEDRYEELKLIIEHDLVIDQSFFKREDASR